MSDTAPPPALPEGFDLEALLAPIAGDAPQGVDLREDYSAQSPYFRLRDARSEAREAERRQEAAEDQTDAVIPPQWKTVLSLGSAALKEKSKDLEVAAWITEAMVRLHGLPGLAGGALLLKGLAEAFWDDVFPLPDEDGIVTRVAPITGLSGAESDGTLMPALRQLPLFRRPDGTGFAWWQYERSVELETIADEERKQARIEAGSIPLADVEKEARAAGQAHFARLAATLAGTMAVWEQMGSALDALAGADGPSTGRVLNLLRSMAEAAAKYGPAPAEGGAAEDGGAGDAAGEAGDGSGAGLAGGVPRASGRSREDLLRQLAEIAEYFRKTEPNAPLSYTLQDAVRRARMSWPELLEEVVPDESTRVAILTSLGIRPPEPPSE